MLSQVTWLPYSLDLNPVLMILIQLDRRVKSKPSIHGTTGKPFHVAPHEAECAKSIIRCGYFEKFKKLKNLKPLNVTVDRYCSLNETIDLELRGNFIPVQEWHIWITVGQLACEVFNDTG